MKSTFGDRNTVGSIYLDAQKNSMKGVVIGDVNSEMLGGLVEDIRESALSDPFNGQEFYINVVEERDLQMKNAFKRRLFVSRYRPYPEDNTLVFKSNPKTQEVVFCWDIPHHSEIPNILSHADRYPEDYIDNIRKWLEGDLRNFGFIRVSMNSSQVEGVPEKTVNAYRKAYWDMCEQSMDAKDLEAEKRLGYFWIPNPAYVDKKLDDKPRISLIGV